MRWAIYFIAFVIVADLLLGTIEFVLRFAR